MKKTILALGLALTLAGCAVSATPETAERQTVSVKPLFTAPHPTVGRLKAPEALPQETAPEPSLETTPATQPLTEPPAPTERPTDPPATEPLATEPPTVPPEPATPEPKPPSPTPPTAPAPQEPEPQPTAPQTLDCQAAMDYGNNYAVSRYGPLGWTVDDSLNASNAGFNFGSLIAPGGTQADLLEAAVWQVDYLYAMALANGCPEEARVNCHVFPRESGGEIWYEVRLYYA